MKIKKYLTALLLIFISAFTFFGCADVEFIRAVDATDTIIDKLVIEIDESKVNKSGVELSTVMNAINDDMTAFRLSVDKWKLQFVSFPELMEALDKGVYIDIALINNKISLAIEFANWQMFGVFYGYSDVENFEYSKAMEDVGPFIDDILNEDYSNENYGLFLIKYSILKNSGILGEIEDFQFNNTNYYDKYVELTNNRYSIEDISVSQIFAYPDDRVYNNADEFFVEGGMTFMRWDFDDKTEGFEMQMYKLSVNAIWWYVLALVISAVVIVTLVIIFMTKIKKQKIEQITRWEVESDGK